MEQTLTAKNKPIFVVGIGASAGGLKPIEEFFDNMPADTGMAFVVVQHLSPDFKSLMDELLARHTKMPIHKVSDGIEIEPNSIYLLPPKKSMAMSDGNLLLSDKSDKPGLNLPIDVFFKSLAEDAGTRAVAIVLSGTGSDGSRGIKEVHEQHGLVLVQSLETAGFDGMPRAAISSGVVDLICNPDDMPQRIIDYSRSLDRRAIQQSEFPKESSSDEEELLSQLFRLFRQRHNLDFSLYKRATIMRRLARRVQLAGAKQISDYLDRLETDTQEADDLYRDLLVEVTHFFRDPEAFRKLREKIIPEMIQRSDPDAELRIWVSGCATGEEAYSIAMLVAEGIAREDRTQKFKVFATDVHRKSLEVASAGFYSNHVMETVPLELHKYFVRNGSICNISREIRQNVIFAANDLTRDPPFTRIDLLTCRNVLIYLEPKVQKRILSMFHFGLRVGGVLFLGPSETVGDLSDEFNPLDRHWRIYGKRRNVRLPEATRMPRTPVLTTVVQHTPPPFVAQNSSVSKRNWLSSTYEDLLAKHVPPSLLVDEFNELVHCFGEARRLLSPPEGKPSNDILKMLDKDLGLAVKSAMNRAKDENKPVTYKDVRIRLNEGRIYTYCVTVEPYRRADRSMFLISLEPTDEQTVRDQVVETFSDDGETDERFAQLERELNYTRETLQATVEELESSNEELQATNEELIASNEELQSTNEELHSVNEELYTVNSEHKEKIEELTELTSDMDNLLRSTEIGTIFLGRNFEIRMFTPSITSGFNIMPQDVGRPISHIAYKLDNPNVLADAESVLNSGKSMEIEVTGSDGKTYLQRIQPYRVENRIEGTVLTLTEISAVKEAEAVRNSMITLNEISQELPDFAYAVSHDLQAPLRHISQYTQILESALEAGKQEEVTRSSKVIRNSAATMRTMLDALLGYSRINSQGKMMDKVKLESSVNSAIFDLNNAIDALQATVNISGDLPEVMGDAVQLKLLFFHLIDNALKFHGDQDPKVDITCHQIEDHFEISVSDNGIGIEDRNAENVFTIFRRLGMKDDVPGAGVGLAICRRIVLRHRGRIWLEPDVDQGTTIKFTLPINMRPLVPSKQLSATA